MLLANERTLLAWLRTALALLAAGLAVTELLSGPAPARMLLGLPLIMLGGIAAAGGYRRWLSVERALYDAGPLPRTRFPFLLAAGVVAAAAGAALLAVFVLPLRG